MTQNHAKEAAKQIELRLRYQGCKIATTHDAIADIQAAIDAACAEKDAEIERLKAELDGLRKSIQHAVTDITAEERDAHVYAAKSGPGSAALWKARQQAYNTALMHLQTVSALNPQPAPGQE